MSKTLLAGMLMLAFVACAPAPAPASAAATVPDQPAPVVNATPCVLRDLSDCSRGDLQRLREAFQMGEVEIGIGERPRITPSAGVDTDWPHESA